MQKKLLIAAMPSSGSDWFASCIRQSAPDLVSHPTAKEPLNPICNLEHFDELAKVFGCEAEPAIQSIAASPSQEQVDQIIKTVLPANVNFIKEVWVGYQLPQLAKHFEIITLTREFENTFPPSRVRVYAWYLAIAKSIEINTRGWAILPTRMRDRVRKAYEIYRDHLIYHNPRASLSWESLMHATTTTQLINLFSPLKLHDYLDCQLLARNIIATRTARQ